jgi:Protein of unknown function (DUF1565)
MRARKQSALLSYAFALAFIFPLACLTGCGGGDGGGGSSTPFYTVNGATGSDATGNGITVSYKTITKALSLAHLGDTVTVAPGTYDNVLGETFPIVIPSGVKLIGDEANKGNGSQKTFIFGGGGARGGTFFGATIYPNDNTTVAGFIITNTNAGSATFPMGIVIDVGNITIKNNRIVGALSEGIYFFGGGSNSVVSGNFIDNNLGVGIAFVQGAGPGTKVENNVITHNNYGVEYDAPTASGDLGGGSTGSVGGNVLANNTIGDLVTSGVMTISARNNYWNHVPPDTLTDIINAGGGATIDTTGALLAP